MARKSKKNGSDSANGVVEIEASDLDSTERANIAAHAAMDSLENAAEVFQDDVPDEPMDAAAEEAGPPSEVPMPGPLDRPVKPAEPEPDPLWVKLVELQKQADAAGVDAALAAEEAKRRKKEHEAKTEEVLALIRRSAKPMPLFDRKAEADDAAERDGEECEVMATEPVLLKIAGVSDAAAEAIAVEDFQSIPIWALVDFGMPKKYVGILVDGGVETIGDIKKLGDRGYDVTSVKGVGESARDKINAAMDEMWRARGEQQTRAAAARDAESPAADWVDPDVAEDPEDWGPADATGLTDAEAAGVDPRSLESEREMKEFDGDPADCDDDEAEGDGYQSDPDYDDPSEPTYDQDDDDQEGGESDGQAD